MTDPDRVVMVYPAQLLAELWRSSLKVASSDVYYNLVNLKKKLLLNSSENFFDNLVRQRVVSIRMAVTTQVIRPTTDMDRLRLR